MGVNYKSVNLSDEQLLNYSKGKIYNYKDISLKGSDPIPVMGGLYDRRIFGSERYCNCGKSFSSGHVCPVCAVHIDSEVDLKKNYGHIELNYPYVSPFQIPTFVKLLNKIFGSKLNDLKIKISRVGSVNALMSVLSKLVFTTEQVEVETPFRVGSQNYDINIDYASDESEFNLMGLHGLKAVLGGMDLSGELLELYSMIHNVLLVSPAVVRKFNITNVSGKPIVHVPSATIDYQAIVYVNNIINEILSKLDNNYEKISRAAGLALLVDAYLNKNSLTASSKQSFIRKSASTRAYESGRATIISDFDLNLTQVSIPKKLLYHAISYEIINGMKELTQNPEAEYRDMTKLAMDTFDSVISHSCAIIVRNPSLHKYNETAFNIVPSDRDVIGLPPLVCQGYNADFDGDQCAFFICTNEITSAEVMQTMSAEAHWYYTKNKKPVYSPNRELLQGLGEATKVPVVDPNLVENKGYPIYDLETAESKFDVGELLPNEPIVINNVVTTYGRAKISKILEKDLDDVIGTEEHIRASNIALIMTLLLNLNEGTEKLKELQNFSVEVLKRVGITTLTLKNLYVDSNKYASGFRKIIDSDMSVHDKDFELTREMGKVLKEMIDDLGGSELKKTIEESNRYKIEQLTSLIGPTIIPTKDGFDVEMSSYLDSKGTRAYVEDCINNRTLWKFKQEMVPTGGYNARQLNVISSIQFVPKSNPNKDIMPIYLPNENDRDLKRLKGREIIGPAPIPGFVEVRSCIFNGENKVYSNEIDSSIYRNKMGNLHEFNIGIDMNSSLSESFTQSSLGLKHGGSEWVFTDEAFRAPFDCSIVGIEDDYIVIRGANGLDYKYPLPANYELTSSLDLKKGDIIFTLKEKVHITRKLADISGFLGTVSVIDQLKDVEFSQCYSLDDGVIHYESGMVTIGSCVLPRHKGQIYYYPEGHKVSKFTRICSGIQNMKATAQKLNDKRLEFIIFRKQLLRLLPDLNPDICEVVFKCISDFNYSVKSTLDKGTNLISSLYMGSPVGGKKVLTNFVNKEIKLFDENDLLYKLIFAQGLTEV